MQSQSSRVSSLTLKLRMLWSHFPCRSVGGPDGMRPQHIKDMISGSAAERGCFFLRALVSFVNFVLSRAVKQSVYPFFFGVNFIAFNKKEGGVCQLPLAICCRDWLKSVLVFQSGMRCRNCWSLFSWVMELKERLRLQYMENGFSLKICNEARSCLSLTSEMPSLTCEVIRCWMHAQLRSWRQFCPHLCTQPILLHQYFSGGDKLLASSEGAEQGDPLVHLLFCLTVHQLIIQWDLIFTFFLFRWWDLRWWCWVTCSRY